MKAQQTAEATPPKAAAAPATTDKPVNRKRRMSYKEQKEFESLSVEIDSLTAEKKELEDAFNSGNVDDLSAKSARYEEVKNLLDEKEMRWLELSEI